MSCLLLLYMDGILVNWMCKMPFYAEFWMKLCTWHSHPGFKNLIIQIMSVSWRSSYMVFVGHRELGTLNYAPCNCIIVFRFLDLTTLSVFMIIMVLNIHFDICWWYHNYWKQFYVYSTSHSSFSNEFSLKDLSNLSYFLGIEVCHTSNGLILSLQKYIRDLLEKAEMSKCKFVHTPLSTSIKIGKHDAGSLLDPTRYRQLVGSLQYLSLIYTTRHKHCSQQSLSKHAALEWNTLDFVQKNTSLSSWHDNS